MIAYSNVSPVGRSLFWGSPVLRDGNGKLYCPGYTGETYAASQWDYVSFGPDVRTPGVAEVKVNRAQASDVKPAAGKDGATVTLHGVRPAEVVVTLKIWTPQQLDELHTLWDKIMPRAGKTTAQIVTVAHPVLTLHNVRSMVVLRGEGPLDGPAPKIKLFTISGVEYVKPANGKNATKTPTAPAPTVFDPQTLSLTFGSGFGDGSRLYDDKNPARSLLTAAVATMTPGALKKNTGP